MATQDVIIQCRNLTKMYRMGGQDIYALRDMNLDVFQGEYLSVMGPSGSGKSTLFNMIGALDRPTSGGVFIAGVDLTAQSSGRLAFFRNQNIGYIFQAFNLIPALTALRNVMLPVLFSGADTHAAAQRAKDVLAEVGLEHRFHHRPDELSGGQQQRVAIARGLAMSPGIMLADEPTANLDSTTGEQILDLMKKINREMETTFIFSTHDAKIVDLADHIIRLRDGLVTENVRQERG